MCKNWDLKMQYLLRKKKKKNYSRLKDDEIVKVVVVGLFLAVILVIT